MSGTDVARRAGISYRRLDYWQRRGFLTVDGKRPPPSGSGHDREFDDDEIARLLLMSRMVKAGIRPTVASVYARSMVAGGTRTVLIHPPGLSPLLITIGT